MLFFVYLIFTEIAFRSGEIKLNLVDNIITKNNNNKLFGKLTGSLLYTVQ